MLVAFMNFVCHDVAIIMVGFSIDTPVGTSATDLPGQSRVPLAHVQRLPVLDASLDLPHAQVGIPIRY